ncbi:hypothetical protein SESBI_12557 [Sesbania bispinosa]|nr:hypothetical protein SESBI_12557 [Sesbania bispinosa]
MGPTKEEPIALTRRSIFSKRASPGLGPNTLDELYIAKEHIGLSEPVIIMDHPSPKILPQRDGNFVSMDLDQVCLCKQSWLFKQAVVGHPSSHD